MRGFGAPQTCFAGERLMDELADRLGIDRVELRRRNVLQHRFGAADRAGHPGERAGARVPRRGGGDPRAARGGVRGPRRHRVPRRRRERQPRRVAAARRRVGARLQEHRVQRGVRRHVARRGSRCRPGPTARSRRSTRRRSSAGRACSRCWARSPGRSSASTRSCSSRTTRSGSARPGPSSASRQTFITGGAVPAGLPGGPRRAAPAGARRSRRRARRRRGPGPRRGRGDGRLVALRERPGARAHLAERACSTTAGPTRSTRTARATST